MIKILLTGCTGKMGKEAVKTILSDKELKLVGCLGHKNFLGDDIGSLAINKETGLKICSDFDSLLEETKPDILLDLTHAEPALNFIKKSLLKGVKCVSGATGFSEEQLNEIKKVTEENNLTTLIVPNFSIGAVLMMKFSEMAGKYFNDVEIIELHHEKKKDSPSGTAIKTAEMILKNSGKYNSERPDETIEKVHGCRGGTVGNINIHSVRMPGFVATQEVIFGGLGQSLTIKHETINREAFMPGVIFSVRKANELTGYIYGLENLI